MLVSKKFFFSNILTNLVNEVFFLQLVVIIKL